MKEHKLNETLLDNYRHNVVLRVLYNFNTTVDKSSLYSKSFRTTYHLTAFDQLLRYCTALLPFVCEMSIDTMTDGSGLVHRVTLNYSKDLLVSN